MADLREHSKQNWISKGCLDQINAGSLQRIADATELMAKNYQQLLTDIERYKIYQKENLDQIDSLDRRISAYKAVITRLKNRKEKA